MNVAELALLYKKTVIIAAIVIMAVTVWPFVKLGTEFMPPCTRDPVLYAGDGAAPSVSVVTDLLKLQDRLLMQIPEVAQVFARRGGPRQPRTPLPSRCSRP